MHENPLAHLMQAVAGLKSNFFGGVLVRSASASSADDEVEDAVDALGVG
jgi:hypothetical protein